MENEEKKSYHKGHRSRLKSKFLAKNGEDLEAHEMLEILLYYALPQRNTNELAHELLRHFGGISGVLEANVSDLMGVKGVKENTATLLKLQLAMFRTYMREKNEMKNMVMTEELLTGYLKSLFIGYKDEAMFAVMLDEQERLICSVKISEGTKYKAPLYTRELIKKAVETGAASVILAHNHPGGDATPSKGDLNTTTVADVALSYVNVQLLDHIIIADDNYASVMGYLKRPSYIGE